MPAGRRCGQHSRRTSRARFKARSLRESCRGRARSLSPTLAAFVILGLTLAGALAMNVELWILAAVLFLGGVQLISIGILGRYLARVHEQTLERPLYLVSRIVGGVTRPEIAADPGAAGVRLAKDAGLRRG